MLDALRRHATGWVAKFLFVLLILSFAVWGIGDIFLGTTDTSEVAEVDGTTISGREVTQEFETQWRQLQEQFGQQLDRQAAASLGVMNQALQTVIARRLVDAHARSLDLVVADETVAERIRQDPSFQGAGGFDRARFDLFLRSIGMSEQDYVAALRNDLLRGSLVEALGGPVSVPDTLVTRLVEHRREQRRGKALLVRAGEMAVGEPDQATLETYLKDNAQAYEAPEYRGLSLLVLRPEDLVEEIEIAEDELQRTYDSRIDQYRKPEQRRVEQLLATDEAALRRAAELVAGGQSFTEAAAAVPGVERTEVGPLARGDLPAGLDEGAWALAEGGVSQPVQSPFGWHLLRVAGIEPEETQPFAAVRDELRRELALERAANELPDLATRLDDELAAGTPLEEAARKVGFEVSKLERVDRTGHDPAGERLAADRLSGEILDAAFAGVEGETSLLQQTRDGRYFVYHVDSTQPARPRTVDEVRDELAAAWKAAEQKKQARAKAEELRGRAASPADLDQLAVGEPAAQIIPIGPVTRDDRGLLQGLDAAAIAAMFATEAGTLAEGVVDVPDGAAIVATEEVLPATVEQPLVDATEAAILSSVRNELIAAYEAALRQRFSVTVNQAALAQLMEAQVPDGGP